MLAMAVWRGRRIVVARLRHRGAIDVPEMKGKTVYARHEQDGCGVRCHRSISVVCCAAASLRAGGHDGYLARFEREI